MPDWLREKQNRHCQHTLLAAATAAAATAVTAVAAAAAATAAATAATTGAASYANVNPVRVSVFFRSFVFSRQFPFCFIGAAVFMEQSSRS